MVISESDFKKAVEKLKKLAREGALLAELLEAVKADVADRSSPVEAALAFYRAFDIPLFVASSLAGWSGFNAQNEGVSTEQLEAEFGELVRSSQIR